MKTSGWPDDWAERKRGLDCHMCEGRRDGHVDDLRTVYFLPSAKAWIVPKSVLPGYCVVAFDGRHASEVFELTPEESAAYWSSVALVAQAIDRVFSPMKVNLMTLGNWAPHLHTHVFPRYADDPAPGNPISYAEMTSDDPIPQAELDFHAERMSAELRRRSATRRRS